MRLSELTFKLYRASSGTSSFWRWEVLQKRRKASLKSGFIYGTIGDAKQHVSAVMLELAGAGKMPPRKKSDRRE
jgi:hypothetical protein